ILYRIPRTAIPPRCALFAGKPGGRREAPLTPFRASPSTTYLFVFQTVTISRLSFTCPAEFAKIPCGFSTVFRLWACENSEASAGRHTVVLSSTMSSGEGYRPAGAEQPRAPMTFARFIAAPENRAAFLAAQDVAQCVCSRRSQRRTNPLFLHGPPGTGK